MRIWISILLFGCPLFSGDAEELIYTRPHPHQPGPTGGGTRVGRKSDSLSVRSAMTWSGQTYSPIRMLPISLTVSGGVLVHLGGERARC